MQIEENKRIVKVLQTTKGQIRSFWSTQEQTPVPFILFNQHFTQQISKSPSSSPLTIQSLPYHISNPYTLQNTSLSWASIQHEYREIMVRNNIKQQGMLIFQSSNYNQKIPEIFSRFPTVKGYNYRIKLNSTSNLSQEKLALMKEAHVMKQIQMEFALGNGQFRPGFIGEVTFQELEQPVYEGIIMAYMNYSAKTGCPVVVDFANQGEQSYRFLFEGQAKKVVQRIQQKLNVIQGILGKFKEKNCAQNVILYNLPIVLLFRKQNFSTVNYFEARIKALVQKFGINLGFNLLRYSPYLSKQGIDEIIKLCQSHTSNVIISSALQYKTDLQSMSGQGLSLYCPSSQNGLKDVCYLPSAQYIRHFLSSEQLQQVLKRNILRIFDWKQRKEEIKIEIFWKCENCKGDFPQTLQAFGKFGKQFCSIKCLKAYKF